MAAHGGWLAPGWIWPTLIALILAELAVPLWAESKGPPTPWHAHHVAERYSGFVIIILGESILGAANAIGNGVQASGLSPDKYNEMSAAVQTDNALRQRLTQVLNAALLKPTSAK